MKSLFLILFIVIEGRTSDYDVQTFDGLCLAPDWMIWAQKMKRKYGDYIAKSNLDMSNGGHFCKFCNGDLVSMVKRRCCGVDNTSEDSRLRRDVHNPISKIFHPRNGINIIPKLEKIIFTIFLHNLFHLQMYITKH